MCSHYQMLKERDRAEKYFRARGMDLPPKWDMFPKKPGVFIRGEDREIVVGRWGLIPAQTRPDYLPKAEKLPTSNARSETAYKLYSFRNAWAKGQRCIVPAEAIYEPDWRSGKSIPTMFTRADGAPMGIAGLWDRYKDQSGAWQESYTMLTINADKHSLFKNYHRPEKEKRMVVILHDEDYEGWLAGDPAEPFLMPYPADAIEAQAATEAV